MEKICGEAGLCLAFYLEHYCYSERSEEYQGLKNGEKN